VLARAGDPPKAEELIYPVFDKGTRDIAAAAIPGTFRLTGHYRQSGSDYYDWMKERGHKAPPRGRGDRHEYWRKVHPVFVVRSWCAVPTGDKSPAVPDDWDEEIPEEEKLTPAEQCV